MQACLVIKVVSILKGPLKAPRKAYIFTESIEAPKPSKLLSNTNNSLKVETQLNGKLLHYPLLSA